MVRGRRIAITVGLLVLASCTPRDPTAQAPPPQPSEPTAHERSRDAQPAPNLDPAALALIEELRRSDHRIEQRGDEVTSPESFALLVALGPGALPTILHVAETTDDAWTRDLLIDVAGRIGDPSARPRLERLLGARSASTASEAVEALGRLGSAESIPALRAALAEHGEVDFEGLHLLETLYLCGEQSALGEVLAVGLAHPEHRFYAAQILSRHQALRDALGFEGPYRDYEFIDEELFFPAAEEWYREAVLGEPPRCRVTLQAEFSEPHRAEKRSAWELLRQACEDGNDPRSHVRVSPVDPPSYSAGRVRPLSVITGHGHAHYCLDVLAWRAEPDGRVRAHRFRLRRSEPRSVFPEDLGEVTYATATFDAEDHGGLVAGLRTILSAELTRWWSGPGLGSMWSSGNFTVVLHGLGADVTPMRFCGYPTSDNRVERLAPAAARDWLHDYLAERPPFREAEPDAAARAVFTAIFRREQLQWGSARSLDWWWVRERMVMLAGAFGDDTLPRRLAAYLAPEYTGGPRSSLRVTAMACNALAALTGKDLRFGPDGAPRRVREVAADYRALLEEG